MIPEIFNRHIGVWEGTVIKVNPQGERKLSFPGTLRCRLKASNQLFLWSEF